MAVHRLEHNDDDAECSGSYFQRGRVSTKLRCCQLALAVGSNMNNAGYTIVLLLAKALAYSLHIRELVLISASFLVARKVAAVVPTP